MASLGLDVDADSTVTSLSVAHTTPVSIASGKTLSGAITVSAGSIKLDETGDACHNYFNEQRYNRRR